MNLAAVLLLPRLLTGGAEPANAVKLAVPRVQYRPNEASATRSPWIDANGWRIMREPSRSFVYDVTGDAAALAPMDPYNWRADYGNSNWDLRHRFVAGVVYDLPFVKSSPNLAVKQALANWQVNLLATIQSGFPFNITIAPDQANTGASNQRPNVTGVPHADCGSGRLANCISTAEFLLPIQYTYGNFGRNVLRGPGLVNWDFSLFKNIPIHERAKFQIRAEVFNLLNTPGFANPNAAIGTPPSAVGGTGAIPGNFGTVTTTVNNNRQIQLAARFTF